MDPLTLFSLLSGGLQAGQAISSGVKGSRAQKELGAKQTAADQTYQQMLGQGQQMLGGMMGDRDAFGTPKVGGDSTKGSGVGLDKHILDRGMAGADALSGIYGGAADAMGNRGLADRAAGIFGGGGISSAMNQYDFQAPQQMAGDMVTQALAMGDRARIDARGNLAGQTTQLHEGLGAALSDMGMGPNSGAAARALQGNALQGMQQMAGLERNIADMAGQAGLQGAQLDTQNLLNFTGMGSQYNMGMNQLQTQVDQGLNQFNLGGAQGLAGLQGMQDQSIQQQAAMRAAGVTDPLQMMQGIYQQNYLNPRMQMNQMMTGVMGQLFGGGIGGMEAGLDRRSKAAQQAGSGKGAASAGATASGKDALTGIQSGKGTKGGSSKGAGGLVDIPRPNVGVNVGSYSPRTAL